MTARTASPSPSAFATELTEHARTWTDVTLTPHSTRAVAFQLDDVIIGVLQPDGWLDVPVPAPIRTALVDANLAVAPPGRPSADWVSSRITTADDVRPATLLLRLSYLYRRLLRSPDAAALRRIQVELNQYALSSPLQTVYETMLDKRRAGLAPSPPRTRLDS
jgi:hypothetical protein